MHLRLLVLAAIGFTLVVISATAAAGAHGPSRATTSYLTPSTVSPACQRTARQRAACTLVRSFFHAANGRRFGAACSMLGQELRAETYGMTCPDFLAAGVPEAMPWGIVGARTVGSAVVVVVTLGQSELDHIRMRTHRAFVGVESGRLQITRTQIVA